MFSRKPKEPPKFYIATESLSRGQLVRVDHEKGTVSPDTRIPKVDTDAERMERELPWMKEQQRRASGRREL